MHKERPTTQFAMVKPTVENVISYNQYRRTQPMVNGIPMTDVSAGCNDTVVLFGGGRQILLGSLSFRENENRIEDVEFFVLSTGILLWFNQLGNGIQIPFESVLCHGSVKVSDSAPEGHKYELLLTLQRDKLLNDFFAGETTLPNGCSLSSIDLTLKPKYSLYDRHCNPDIENLFTFDNFGVNRGDNMVDNCNKALALCLEIYNYPNYDDDDDDDDDDDEELEQDDDVIGNDENSTEAMFTSINDTWNRYSNSGLADDLES